LNACLTSNPHYPGIPWIDIYGMRNRIAHGYFFINFGLVWIVVAEHIPDLRPKIAKVLEDMSDKG
jgi:uncharacterized protein with HEPN domain